MCYIAIIFICVTWHTSFMTQLRFTWAISASSWHASFVTHSYVWHWYLLIRDMSHSWHIHICDTTSAHFCMGNICFIMTWLVRDIFIRVTWYLPIRDMPHSWHIHTCDICSFVKHLSVTLNMCAIAYSFSWRDSFMRVTWIVHTCDIPHAYVLWGGYM